MVMADAVMDSSFWINAERSGLITYLPRFFTLHVPPIVARALTVLVELMRDPPAAATTFALWHEQGLIQIVAPDDDFNRFDVGEDQAIALARERQWTLLIDDEAPWHFSRGPLKLRVVDSPAFAVFLYDHGHLGYRETVRSLDRSRAGRRVIGEALIALDLLVRKKGDSP